MENRQNHFFNDVERLFDKIHKKGGLEKENKHYWLILVKKLHILQKKERLWSTKRSERIIQSIYWKNQ